jgi:hypothetical protein
MLILPGQILAMLAALPTKPGGLAARTMTSS